MNIHCFDEDGTPFTVDVRSDRRFLLLWILGLASVPFPIGLIVGAPLFGSLWLASRVLHSLRIRRGGWQPMPPELAQELQALATRFAHPLGLRALPRFLWKPTQLTVGGQLLNPLSGVTVGISGGLAVLLAARDPRGEAVLAHELAHVANRDQVIFPLARSFALGWFVAPLVVIALLYLSASGNVGAPVELLGMFISLPLTWYVFYRVVARRELIADAIALNLLSDRRPYLELLKGQRLNESRWHPPPAERMEAATRDSPVLRSRWTLSATACAVGVGIATGPLDILAPFLSEPALAVGLLVLVSIGLGMAHPIVDSERSKLKTRKYPRTAGETAPMPIPLCTECWTWCSIGTVCPECGGTVIANEGLLDRGSEVLANLHFQAIVEGRESAADALGLEDVDRS